MVPLAEEDGASDNDDVVRIVTALTLYINLCMMLDVYSPFLSFSILYWIVLRPVVNRMLHSLLFGARIALIKFNVFSQENIFIAT